jgi:putative ubiquitin-RnfH superfamily antitoxin RatB of RatAB toxin-antitoxin module
MAADDALMVVELVRSAGPRQVEVLALSLPQGATVATALQAAAWPRGELAISVWGRAATLEQPLRDRDRIELTRPLTVDPKEARRLRYNKQGKRKTGPRISGSGRGS